VAHLGKLKEDQKALSTQISEMVVYSNGAISWSEAWLMSPAERELFINTMNKYNAQKSGKPTNELL
jgi:hypothetical protein